MLCFKERLNWSSSDFIRDFSFYYGVSSVVFAVLPNFNNRWRLPRFRRPWADHLHIPDPEKRD
ncbi:hypothetical protein BDW72DRAFT_188983 [Aspergillus terricola var. indicus]